MIKAISGHCNAYQGLKAIVTWFNFFFFYSVWMWADCLSVSLAFCLLMKNVIKVNNDWENFFKNKLKINIQLERFVLFLWNSLCRSGWPQTHGPIPASSSQVLELKVWVTPTGFQLDLLRSFLIYLFLHFCLCACLREFITYHGCTGACGNQKRAPDTHGIGIK